MGDHRNNPRAQAARQPAPRMPIPPRLLDAAISCSLTPKPHLLILPGEDIEVREGATWVRALPAGAAEGAERTWQPIADGREAWPAEKELGPEQLDIVFFPVSVCLNTKLVDANGNPRRSVLQLNALIARADYKSLTDAHERQLMGHLADMPGALAR